jgi:hypothetical protein
VHCCLPCYAEDEEDATSWFTYNATQYIIVIGNTAKTTYWGAAARCAALNASLFIADSAAEFAYVLDKVGSLCPWYYAGDQGTEDAVTKASSCLTLTQHPFNNMANWLGWPRHAICDACNCEYRGSCTVVMQAILTSSSSTSVRMWYGISLDASGTYTYEGGSCTCIQACATDRSTGAGFQALPYCLCVILLHIRGCLTD